MFVLPIHPFLLRLGGPLIGQRQSCQKCSSSLSFSLPVSFSLGPCLLHSCFMRFKESVESFANCAGSVREHFRFFSLEPLRPSFHCRLLHTRTTFSRCLMLHRTIHALWNLYGNPYKILHKRKKKQAHDEGMSRYPHVYL